MQVLDRYILKLWFGPFIGFFLIVNIILLFGRLLKAIEAFGENPIDAVIIAKMLFSILPYFIILTLPFAFFFALLKVLSYLQNNSESDAFLAAGISRFRLMRPMLVMAVAFWIFLTWTAMVWMPAGQRSFNELYYAVQKTTAMPSFTPGQFTQGLDGLTIYHAGKDKEGHMQKFVLEDKRASPATIYIAKDAMLQRGGDFLLLTMNDGTYLEGEGLSLRTTSFDTLSLSFNVEGVGTVKGLAGGSKIPSFLSQDELEQLADKGATRYVAEWHRRWLLPSTIFILFLFVIPLSHQQKRTGKARGWMWGVALMLSIYNIQIVLHKKVALGLSDAWLMWSGQILFMLVGLLLSYLAVKYNHYQWQGIIKKVFRL